MTLQQGDCPGAFAAATPEAPARPTLEFARELFDAMSSDLDLWGDSLDSIPGAGGRYRRCVGLPG